MNLKHKNIVLLIGFIILLWICYKIPVHQTIMAKKEYAKLVQQQHLFSDIPQKVNTLNTEKVYLDSILNTYQLSTDKSFQSNLLHTITSFADTHHLSVVTFEEPHIYLKNEVTLNTFSFSVKGNYNDTLSLIHELEQTKKLGKMLSINFEKKKNYRTNKEFLETTILLQRLED